MITENMERGRELHERFAQEYLGTFPDQPQSLALAHPLAESTRRRIAEGIARFVHGFPNPTAFTVRNPDPVERFREFGRIAQERRRRKKAIALRSAVGGRL